MELSLTTRQPCWAPITLI